MNAPAVHVAGIGAVSPAGWSVDALRDALAKEEPLPARDLPRPGWPHGLRIRPVANPPTRPAFLAHPRLRRTSPITQYALGAALEALAGDLAAIQSGSLRVGTIVCVMSGCVNYSRRFYDETLRDPATASPLVFPETVFNAPASHIASLLGSREINYTLVGDPGTFLQGLALAGSWIAAGRLDGCLVVGAEEHDWLTSDAFRMFQKQTVLADGAGALYLRASQGPVRLEQVTDAELYQSGPARAEALQRMASQLPRSLPLVVDGLIGSPALDAQEESTVAPLAAQRLSPKKVLGEGFVAAAAWQCVAAVDALQRAGIARAAVTVGGCNQQAIGALFSRAS